MTDRTSDNDNELIDELAEAPTPGQSNASGSELVGQRDEPALPNLQD